MTGPWHYREAEKLIAAANRRLGANDAEWLHTPERRAELRAEAAIHATLADAAATALKGNEESGLPRRDWDDWHRAAGVKPVNEEPQP